MWKGKISYKLGMHIGVYVCMSVCMHVIQPKILNSSQALQTIKFSSIK